MDSSPRAPQLLHLSALDVFNKNTDHIAIFGQQRAAEVLQRCSGENGRERERASSFVTYSNNPYNRRSDLYIYPAVKTS